jgi:uncharacterized SAM-binding protein YcdF (DUF218 family)
MSILAIANTMAAWLIPPGCLIVLAAWGLLRMRKHPRSGKTLSVLALASLWALSTPWLSRLLLQAWEPVATNVLQAPPAQAIVVLGGGQNHAAPEFGDDTVNDTTLTRVRYAAHLHRLTGKPVLVSGGSPEGNPRTEAQVMKAAMENDFKVAVTWTETASANTLENARASRALLAPLGIHRIYLVTHARHMPRSRWAFTQAGFDVVAAPTAFATHFRVSLVDFMPRGGALRDSSDFFHEIIGLAWYRLKSMLIDRKQT